MYKGNLLRAFGFLIVFTVIGCNSGSDESTVTDSNENTLQGEYLFAATYDNWAWGEEHKGVFIDVDGNIYQFNDRLEAATGLEHGKSYSEQEIKNHFGEVDEYSLLAQVDQPELLTMAAKILTASSGSLTEPLFEGADRGTFSLLAFKFEADSKTYQVILLSAVGGTCIHNSSIEANDLAQWISNKGYGAANLDDCVR